MTGEQVETLEQFFTELPVLVDQATRHLHRSNLNLWGHLSRRLYDSLNVFNIPETLTTNIRMFLEELHSIHTRILNIIIFEYDFVLNANVLSYQPNQYTQDLEDQNLEFQQLKSIESMTCTCLGKMLLFIWEFQ